MKPSKAKPITDATTTQRPALDRRRLLQAGTASLALSALGGKVSAWADDPNKRVGLIGAGWYGKSDLWRLIQVAPVEVVSICDPDQRMLEGAIEIASERQKSGAKPRDLQRLSQDVGGEATWTSC